MSSLQQESPSLDDLAVREKQQLTLTIMASHIFNIIRLRALHKKTPGLRDDLGFWEEEVSSS